MNTAMQPLGDFTENDVPAMAGTLQELLSEISSRVNLADARYVDIIGEMQGKLAALDGLAKSARAKAEETQRLEAEAEAKRQADEEAAAEAKRIEDAENARKRAAESEAAEAKRLAKAVQAAKAAAAAAIESTASRAYQGEVDTFDIIDHAPVRAREPWDAESANVFIRHFEQMDPPGMLQPRRSGGLFYPEPQVPARHSVTQNAVATIGDDRAWLEGRFNDIASRISEMMTSGTTRELGSRFDHLEDRIDAAMTTVTAQAENGADTLKLIEAHIAEIDEHVDYIRKELSRLDIVEAHIRGLMERQSAAESAYQNAPAALPAPHAANEAQEGIVQLTGLLQRLVEERKHTEEHTISMLDTLQQAMIRVLDRMDAIEAGAESETDEPAAEAHHDHYHAEHDHAEAGEAETAQQATQPAPPAQQAPAEVPQRQHRPQHHHLTPPAHAQHAPRHPSPAAFSAPRHEFFDFEMDEAHADMTRAAQLAADEAASAAALAQPSTPANIGQIRRNLISEAQRARHGGQGGDTGVTQLNAAQSAARAAQAQTRASILERITQPTSRHLAIAALALMIPLNAMFLYLVLGSSKPSEPADFHTATEMPLAPERYTEASRAIASEPPVSKAADPLPSEDLGRISPPASEPVAHQSATEAPAASGTMELPPANVGPLTLRKAASDGDPSAQFEVAARLAEGKGIDQDFKTAVLWYQRSASRGFAQSQYRIGTHYERGLGVEKDPERAKVWYQRAAEQGNVKAMHNLAVLSTNRPDGKPDYAEALKWFSEAANYNLPDSQFNLAVLHESGLGTAKDPKTAYVWFSLASRSGDREASRRREATKAQLSADAVAAADEEVKNFRPKAQSPVVNDPRTAGEQWKRRQVTEN